MSAGHEEAGGSSAWELAEGRFPQTCSADDLVVHKAFASRDQDWADVDGILMRQGPRLDVKLIFEEIDPAGGSQGGAGDSIAVARHDG